MDIKKIKKEINKTDKSSNVDKYIAYIDRLSKEKNKQKQLKNPWMQYKKDEDFIRFYLDAHNEGLVFDGESITLQSTGVSYNYQAYKNKMLLAYPETILDVGLVHQGDKFKFSKSSGAVTYTHDIENPFNQSEQTITGAYCVIKNSRGEFLSLLSKQDIAKHRKVARTDYIWANWYLEMAMKTIIKKACKLHFNDIYKNIESIDNTNYDLDQLPQDNSKKITIGEDNLKNLGEFCVRHKITTKEAKAALLSQYKIDLHKTTKTDFNNIFEQIRLDKGESLEDN